MIRIASAILLFLLISNSSNSSEVLQSESELKILRVIDGDTLEISAPFLPKPLKPAISLRISGIDTPEKGFRAHCPEEAIKGELATEFMKKLVANSREKLIIIEKEDKYFRLLGDVLLDGKSLRDSILKEGFGLPYYGEKKPNWCRRESDSLP